MVSEEEEKEHPISDKRELPTSIIIKVKPEDEDGVNLGTTPLGCS